MTLFRIYYLLLPTLVLCSGFYRRPPSRGPHHGSSHYSQSDTHPGVNNECGNELLTCVEKEDCSRAVGTTTVLDGQPCPPYFIYQTGLGYCTTVLAHHRKPQLEAIEICENQGGSLLFIENKEEFAALVKEHTKLKPSSLLYAPVWFDAYYDDKEDDWIRRSNGELINWELIFSEFGTGVHTKKPPNIDVVSNVDAKMRCLTVVYDKKFPEKLRFEMAHCTYSNLYVCKIGTFNNQCQKNTRNMCCFSPTANFYTRNQQTGPGSILSEAEANCFMEIDQAHGGTTIQPCDTVLATLTPTTTSTKLLGNSYRRIPFRIGSSFFYFSGKEDCIGKNARRAVVYNREVHNFISRYMVLSALKGYKTTEAFIGLRYRGKIHKLVWANGKPHDYYNETFWNGGRPDYEGVADVATSDVCAGYRVSGFAYEYGWELIKNCKHTKKAAGVCELPIRVTDLIPTAKKVDCGMRHRRGVLARSSYASGHELQALYGEFPWQVAIYQTRHHVGLVSTFMCSGALIDQQLVITAAHCVLGTSTSYTIVLGEYTIGGGPSVLERQQVGVADILVYPGYEFTNPLAHDIAIVQLNRKLIIDNFPHIGLACLPFPDILYRNTGGWDCYTVGWNGKGGALQKVESTILPSRLCRIHTRPYNDYLGHSTNHHYGRGIFGYDKASGHHLVTYQKHHYFNRRTPDLLCTAPYESQACVDDSSAILVCRAAPVYPDDIFGSSSRGYGYPGYGKPVARIVNAYGKYRFDSEKWYVMGISHSLSPCSSDSKGYGKNHKTKKVQVFTPISEYLNFIHAHQDAKLTSGQSSTPSKPKPKKKGRKPKPPRKTIRRKKLKNKLKQQKRIKKRAKKRQRKRRRRKGSKKKKT